MINVDQIKKQFVSQVIELIKERISLKEVIEISISIADGYADYLICDQGFYMSGFYAEFAGDSMEQFYSDEVLRIGEKTKLKYNNSEYEVRFELETFYNNLPYYLASEILKFIK